MNCIKCNNTIPEGRLKALPGTKVCTECSTENAYYANPVIRGDEDYSELEFTKDPNAIAQLKKMQGESSGHIPNIPD